MLPLFVNQLGRNAQYYFYIYLIGRIFFFHSRRSAHTQNSNSLGICCHMLLSPLRLTDHCYSQYLIFHAKQMDINQPTKKTNIVTCLCIYTHFVFKDFSEDDFKYLIDGWTNKLIRTKAGDQKWGLFLAEKNKAKET